MWDGLTWQGVEARAGALAAAVDPATLTGALVLLALHLAAGKVASALVVRAIEALVSRDRSERIDRLAADFAIRIARVFVWLIALSLYARAVPALDRLGTALLASVSIASVIFGLAAQSTLANLMAGTSLIVYKPFRLGDRVQVAAPTGIETGVVETVTLGYTTLRTADGRRVVLSNSTILNQVTINLTSVDPRVMASVPFRVAHGSDLARVRALALDLARAAPGVQEVAGCPVTALGPSGVDLTLRAWCADPTAASAATSALLEAIATRLPEEGVEIH